ncbi:MAG: universal stress protein [Thermoleophilia bacterium]
MSVFRHIGVCVDDSQAAANALDTARRMRQANASLSVVHCVEPPSFLVNLAAGLGGGVVPDSGPMVDAARAWVETLTEQGETPVVLEGSPARTISEWARDHGCDLLVLATSSTGSAEGGLLGSVAQRLALDAPCSTLLVRGTAD